jgi:hypothetical protein
MAKVCFTVPDEIAADYINALATRGGYDPEEHGDTPQDKNQFAKHVWKDFGDTVYKHFMAETAGNTAKEEAYEQVASGPPTAVDP